MNNKTMKSLTFKRYGKSPELGFDDVDYKRCWLAMKRGLTYTFLFVRPEGSQLSQIGKLVETEQIKPVIDKVFPFAQTKEALGYLAQGYAKGKVAIKMQD
ncbi:zinc-binding dehydrogenase [Serratia proteamaculans]|uniref:zinc-binding dehydrogenase n=1 Tax=Serratia proteamaculans TaxID=28151 RepID=UPI0021AD52E5|nr:zinc-binding dehydrogenase [Serratia proteamaculans]